MVLKILQDGGPVMIVILLLSFVALVLIIERFLYFRKIEKNEKRFLEAIFPLLETRDFQSAEKLCARYSCPVAEMTKAGLLNRRLSSEEMKESMNVRAEAEIPKMERFVGALGTIANIAPLLGLLGTVTGNIKAFGLLGSEKRFTPQRQALSSAFRRSSFIICTSAASTAKPSNWKRKSTP